MLRTNFNRTISAHFSFKDHKIYTSEHDRNPKIDYRVFDNTSDTLPPGELQSYCYLSYAHKSFPNTRIQEFVTFHFDFQDKNADQSDRPYWDQWDSLSRTKVLHIHLYIHRPFCNHTDKKIRYKIRATLGDPSTAGHTHSTLEVLYVPTDPKIFVQVIIHSHVHVYDLPPTRLQ